MGIAGVDWFFPAKGMYDISNNFLTVVGRESGQKGADESDEQKEETDEDMPNLKRADGLANPQHW